MAAKCVGVRRAGPRVDSRGAPPGGGSAPVVFEGLAWVPPGYRQTDITYEVDYQAIYDTTPWFAELVRKLGEAGQDKPHTSHGAHSILANVHRAKPTIAFAYELLTKPRKGTIHLFRTLEYESAGIWVHVSGELALVINAKWDDGETDARLLYASARKERADLCTEMGHWYVVDEGTGNHLKRRGDHIDCSRPTKKPMALK